MDWIVLLSTVFAWALCFVAAVATVAEIRVCRTWISAGVHAIIGAVFLGGLFVCGYGVLECLDRLFPR